MDKEFFTREEKQSEEYQIQQIERAIGELVVDKRRLYKAYNLYNGIRDADQFRHLEENFGIGTPTKIEFTPLVRKHIDVLVGEFLSLELNPKVSCKDKETVTNIFRDKQLEIENGVLEILRKSLNNALYQSIMGNQGQVNDVAIEQEIEEITNHISDNFISEYEKAGQNIITWIGQAQHIDFKNKLKRIILHLLITGTCYYRVKVSPSGDNLEIEVLNPLNTFVERNPNSPYLRDGHRCVIRRYLTKSQILAEYGHLLDDEAIEELQSTVDNFYDASYLRFVRNGGFGCGDKLDGDILTDDTVMAVGGNVEVTPGVPDYDLSLLNREYLPVYEVEWLSTCLDKKNKSAKMYRYKGIRIAGGIYILQGEDENIIRSSVNPNMCSLTINGLYYADENSQPFSLVLKTAHLQDKFDILNFFRDNTIANSGTVGDWIDISMLPEVFGEDVTERLLKWQAYKKGGTAIIDSSQEGRANDKPLNTIFGGFDDSVQAGAIQAIQLAIQSIEETVSTITGVFRERLGGIEQRDAVSNVQVGVKQSLLVTKQYFQSMDLITRDMLIDCLNYAKIAFKKGLTGTIVLGDYRKEIFTALPEHFTTTDFDINIADSTKSLQEMEIIKQLCFELTKAGTVDPEIIFIVSVSKSLTEMKDAVFKSIKAKKQENNTIQQLQQQLEEISQQFQQAQKALEKAQKEVEESKTAKLQIEKSKVDNDYAIRSKELQHRIDYDNKDRELKEKQLELEKLQLFDDNLQNNEIKNVMTYS